MRPSFLDNMAWQMAEVYGAVTDQLLINLAHHFPYIQQTGQMSGSFEYQARMLAQMGKVNQESLKIIMNNLGGADLALRNALTQSILEALKSEEPKLRKAVQQGLLSYNSSAQVAPNMMQAFQTYYRQSADKLNLVNTVMLESTQNAYTATVADIANRINRTQGIMNAAAGETITGVSTWNQAVKNAVNKMVQNGLTGFIDHGGHKWSPEAYVAMDVRTTMFNTARAAVWERADSYGADMYQVSSHNGARPLCYPWQGKIISRSGYSGMTEDIDGNKVRVYPEQDTSKGQAAGLFGINCRHYPMTFIPRFSALRGEPQDPEENEQAYAESQEQRALERKLREERRDLAVMKAQGAPDAEIKAQQEKVKKASRDIDDFCDETGRARQRSREYTPIKATFPDQTAPMPRNQTPAPKPPEKKQEEKKPEEREKSAFLKALENSNIKRVEVGRLGDKLTEQEIIDKIGGADKTTGSCSSLAFAYAGNKAGYDVRDFRGGASCDMFSNGLNVVNVTNNIGGIVIRDGNAFKAAEKALQNVETGKEYYFSVAQHAAIVRKSESGFEYLELQTQNDNKFYRLTENTLRWRFGAQRRRSFHGHKIDYISCLMDIEKIAENSEFKEMLEYINTEASKQRKGVGGGIK